MQEYVIYSEGHDIWVRANEEKNETTGEEGLRPLGEAVAGALRAGLGQ